MPNRFTGIGGWNVVDSEMRSISGNFATTTALNDLHNMMKSDSVDSYDDAHGFYPNATLAAVCKNGKWGNKNP